MVEVKIYALVNPITDIIFYIGKTVGDLNIRLTAHIQDKECNYRKREIIKSIIELDSLPVILELERIECSNEVEERVALLREDYWIKLYLKEGNLCNVANVKTELQPRLLSSYKKESKKSTPCGVTFDVEKLGFIQTLHPNLKTKQKVVDYLLNWYSQEEI